MSRKRRGGWTPAKRRQAGIKGGRTRQMKIYARLLSMLPADSDELHKRSRLNYATLGMHLRRMEKLGLIERRREGTDFIYYPT
jgi:DNA-binding MarR family transcriptional regulator